MLTVTGPSPKELAPAHETASAQMFQSRQSGRDGGCHAVVQKFTHERCAHGRCPPPVCLWPCGRVGAEQPCGVEAVVECAGRFIRPRLCFHYSYSNSRWKRECVTVLAWSQVKRRGKSTCFLMAFFIRVNACGALGQNVLKLHCAVSRPARWTTARSWRRGGSTDAKQWCRV